MNLLDILANGVPGAENGSATIYKRGTSTPATLYANYDGTGAVVPTSSVSLDSNGRAVWYVNEEVDVIVRNATATPVSTFTAMMTASDVEVRSQSFTGTDYSTALSAASYPITAAAVLDLWKTNAGAIDWKVLIGAVPTTLQTAFSSVSGLFFNVKSSIYGAKGDGTTDDQSAIGAAIAAAVAAGGGCIFFPAGTYRIAGTLTVNSGLTLLGASRASTRIALDDGAGDTLLIVAGGPTVIQGLTLRPLQANTGKIVRIEQATTVFIKDCDIGGGGVANGYGVFVDNASAVVSVTSCLISPSANVSYGVYNDTGNCRMIVEGCRFVAPAAFTGNLVRANGGTSVIVGNWFDCSSVTSGTGSVIVAAGQYTIVGNHFTSPGGGTIVPISLTSSNGGNTVSGNSRQQSANWSPQPGPNVAAQNTTHEGGADLERDTRTYHISTDATPITVLPSLYGVAEVRRTTNANQTINGDTPYAPGLMFTLVVNNDQGAGSGTITLGSGFKGLAPFTLAANRAQSITFRSYEVMTAGGAGANKYWGFVNTTGDVTL